MIGLLWLLACGSPRWTEERALEPHLAALDGDQDGRAGEAEYRRARWEGPPFASADQDGDGALSAGELLSLFRLQSPTDFDGGDPQAQRPAVGQQPALLNPQQEEAWEVLAWMSGALLAAGQEGPDPGLVDKAVRSGDLESAAGRAALAEIQEGWLAQGWPWPEGLPISPAPIPGSSPDPTRIVRERIRAYQLGIHGVSGASTTDSTRSPGAQ